MEDPDNTTVVRIGVINRVTINEECLIFETMNGQRVPAFYEIDNLLDLLKKHFALKNDPIELLVDKESEKILDLRILNCGVYCSEDTQKIHGIESIGINRRTILDRYKAEHEDVTEEVFQNTCPYLFERMKFFNDKPSLLGFTQNTYQSDDLNRHMLIGQSIVVELPFDKRHEFLLKNPSMFEWFDRACSFYNEDDPVSPLRLKVLESVKGNTYLVAAQDSDNPHLGHEKFYAVLGTKKTLNRLSEMDPDLNSYTLIDIEPYVSNFFDLLVNAWEVSFPSQDFPFFSKLLSPSRLKLGGHYDAILQLFVILTRKTHLSLTLRENIKRLGRDGNKYPRTIEESIEIHPKNKSNSYTPESHRPSFYTDDEIEGGLSDYLGDNYFD